MNSRSKAPKPTQQNVLSPPLAIPLDLRFMTVNRSASVRRELERLRQQWAHGSSVRHQVPMTQASTDPVHLPLRSARL